MLEYYKLILTKTSFNDAVFIKEYRKSVQRLPRQHVRLLKDWVLKNFGGVLSKRRAESDNKIPRNAPAIKVA